MQATLDSFSLKSFTKALTCLSKYGDELTVHATPDFFSLSATNSSKSAYCRFKYDKQFFSRYRVGDSNEKRGDWTQDAGEALAITGQLLTKRCELSIVEGSQVADDSNSEEQDNLESKMVIKLHCKHGVIKTHRLLILTPTSLLAPGAPERAKADPQLVWNFGDSEVGLKSLETSIDSRGKGQLSTELTISAEEFDVYDVYETPITIAFHLREFNATIAFADSMSLSLDLRFTDPAAPLFIDVEGDSSDILFVISTSQVQGAPVTHNPPRSHSTQNDMQPPEPLFLPSSQLSVEDETILRETGLGVEAMDFYELSNMLEGEGEEVAFDSTQRQSSGYQDNPDSFELVEEAEFAATQTSRDISRVLLLRYCDF
ncbi:Rad9-domain-containing protein [Cyathus striatus]|nr:Rad9-domain-containing protein [Cyathus striatus]